MELRRLLRGLGLALTVAGAPVLAAELRLLCEVEGKALPVGGVERRQIFALDGGKKVPVPADAKWQLQGDLRANAALVEWSPPYVVTRPVLPDRARPAERAPYRASVNLRHATESFGRKVESAFLKSWPGGVPDVALAVFVWLLDGRPSTVNVRVVPSTQRKNFLVSHDFKLSPVEAAGQPIVLVWQRGAFTPPVPRFSEAKAQGAFVAACLDDVVALKAALDTGVKPGAADRNGYTLLSYAAEAGAFGAVEHLLAAGARPNAGAHRYPLAWAVGQGRLKAVERLIAAKASLEGGSVGLPLHSAVRAGFSDIALRLIEAGADVDQGDSLAQSPMTLAIDAGMADVIRALLARKAKFDFRHEQVARVLITQATRGHTEAVKLLLAHKVPAGTVHRGGTALLGGAKAGDPELVRALVAAGASVNQAGEGGLTPLMVAAGSGTSDYAKALLEAGADARAAHADGKTSLHFAAYSGNVDVTRLLLAAGCPVEARDERNESALDIALAGHQRGLAQALVEKGARLDVAGPRAAISIERALSLDLAPLITAALRDGWPIDAKFAGDWPMLRVAEIYEANGCVAALRAAGAAPEAAASLRIAEPRALDARPRLAAIAMPVDPRDIDDEYPAVIVEVVALIDAKGEVRFPRVTDAPSAALAFATIQAVSRWRFVPPLAGGQPVATQFRIPVEFPSSRDRALEESDVDTLPVPIAQMSPVFPGSMGLQGYSGEVRVRFVVNTQGRTEHIRVKSSPHPDFEAAAVKAIENWTFKPALRDGQPVNLRLEVPMVFQSR